MANYNELLTGFSLLANRPIEKHLLLTADEMLNFPTDYSFNGRFCIGYVDSKYGLYIYDSSKTDDVKTGKFHLFHDDVKVNIVDGVMTGTTNAENIVVSGDLTCDGDTTISNGTVSGEFDVQTPTADTHAVNKKYVDDNYIQKDKILTEKKDDATDEELYSAKYINDNTEMDAFVKKEGDTMSGTLKTSATTALSKSSNNGMCVIAGGDESDNGAYLSLSGKDRTTYKGYFYLVANDGTNRKVLQGDPNGALSWNDNELLSKDKVLTAKDTSATDDQLYSAKYINDNLDTSEIANCVKKTGDTMTGTLKFSETTSITSSKSNSFVKINGGDTSANGGAYLSLSGKDSSYKGNFYLGAVNSTGSGVLLGQADGTLTWCDKTVICRDVKYIHNFRMVHATNQYTYWSCMIITTSKTLFTRATLATWLKTNGYTTIKNVYCMGTCGTTGTTQVTTPSGTTFLPNILSGLFSSDGSTLSAKVNYNGSATYNDSVTTVSFVDSVIEI